MSKYCIEVRNVNDGYYRTLGMLKQHGKKKSSRNGAVIALPGLFVAEIRNPLERVLFDANRDANPTFHLLEACWMLAGNRDVAFVSQFNSNMVNYSDDKEIFNAAYGHRWRHHFGYDQIQRAVDMLRANRDDRRVVITMWDPEEDLGSTSLDIPCNQQIICRVEDDKLHFHITNRSNDAVFGLWGANAVHMSFLQEWMARAIGVGIGSWFHTSLNLHIYERHWHLLDAPRNYHAHWEPWPGHRMIAVTSQEADDLRQDCLDLCNGKLEGFRTKFMEETVEPIYAAWREYKAGNKDDAIYIARCIEAADWRKACVEWYKRRGCK